jgi:hypothetical protein
MSERSQQRATVSDSAGSESRAGIADPGANYRPSTRMSTRLRAGGFLRNLGQVHRRVGTGGIVELIAARAFPWASFQRLAIIDATTSAGKLHPELRPQRLRSPEPEIERFHVRLAQSGEPEVPAFMPDMLRQRFAAGHELWTFRADDETAHAKWVVSDCLRFAGRSLPLRPDERAFEAGVTLPKFRRRGLNGRAREHVSGVLASEGVRGILGGINGFNRRLLATTLRIPGTRHSATIYTVSLGPVRWSRAVPTSSTNAALLERRGLPLGRWFRELPAANTVGEPAVRFGSEGLGRMDRHRRRWTIE